jgi:hypothetical protein
MENARRILVDYLLVEAGLFAKEFVQNLLIADLSPIE